MKGRGLKSPALFGLNSLVEVKNYKKYRGITTPKFIYTGYRNFLLV